MPSWASAGTERNIPARTTSKLRFICIPQSICPESSHFRNPIPGPLHRFQFKITDATGEKNHSLDSPLLEPLQAELTLIVHEIQRQRPLLAVIPQVTAEHDATAAGEPFHPLQAVSQVLELVGVPSP